MAEAKPQQADPAQTVDLKQANDLVQSQESRGDFKFKGIQKIFQAVRSWTERFDANGILPSVDQLLRDSQLPDDKIREYIMELLGRGSSYQKVIVAIPSLQYISGKDSRLESMVVFCRPVETDKGSARRYIQSQVEKNVSAINNWLGSRQIQSQTAMREKLLPAIQQGNLKRTRARFELASHFSHGYDRNPEERKATNQHFVRPVLKRLLDTHKLILLQGQAADGSTFNALYINNVDELELRYAILADYFKNHIASGGPSEDEDDKVFIQRAISELGTAYSALDIGAKQVVQELQLLGRTVSSIRKEKEEAGKKESLENALDILAQIDQVADETLFRDFDNDTINVLQGVNGVMHAEYPIRGKITGFYLHRNKIDQAIKHAREILDNHEDETHVRILSAMGLEKYLDSDRYKAFLDLEQRMLFERLPFFTRVWRLISGNRKLSQKEIVKIKKNMSKEQASEMVKIRKVGAAKARKELVSKRMKGETGDGGADRAAIKKEKARADFGKPEEESDEDKADRIRKLEEAKDKLRSIVHCIDKAWENKQFPNRETVLNAVKKSYADEDDFILFLKKYGKKEIFSFRIPIEKPEYIWPILITRRFLKRNGRSLYNKYQSEALVQRKANMPDQEKYDIANAIEMFLGRVLPKM